MSIYGTVIIEQEKVIQAYSTMLHATLNELAQHRDVKAEEQHLEQLDKKGGIYGQANNVNPT